MPTRSLCIALIALVAPAFGCARTPLQTAGSGLPQKAPGSYDETFDSGGISRHFILQVPHAYDATKPLPLVVVLHGWTSSAQTMEKYTGMADEAEKQGYVAVFPDGLGQMRGWNAGFIDLGGKKADDVGFIGAVLDRVEAEVGIDKSRVYVCGHSNGAFLSYYVGAKLSDRLAAIGIVAGTIGVPAHDKEPARMIPEPKAPVSVILIHGKQDNMVAYDSTAKAFLIGVSAPESAKWWAKEDGCSPDPKTTAVDGNETTTLYTGGKSGAEVELVTIANGTHDWPRNPSANKLLFDFFNAHPKTGA